MNLEVRVNTSADLSAIDKAEARIKAFNATITGKLGSTAKGINDEIARTAGIAGRVTGQFDQGQRASMRLLQQRWTFERRMKAQEERQAAAAEKVRREAEGAVLAGLKARHAFEKQRTREAISDARALARAEMQAARDTARAWKDAKREALSDWNRGKDGVGKVVRPLAGAAAAAGAGTAALVRRSLRAEGDVDATEINTRIYGGLTKDQARKLRDGWAAPLAEELGIGTDKLLGAYTDALKLGIPAAGAQAFAGLATKTSAAWEVPFSAVSDILGTVNQLLTSTGAVFDIERLKSVANSLQFLAAKQSTTPEKLISFLQRGAGAAQILGMSMEAGLAFGSASTSLGNQAGQSGRLFDYVASRLVELPKLTRKHSDEGRSARQLVGDLGFGSADAMDRKRRADPDAFLPEMLERLSKIKDPKRQEQDLRFFAGREWFGEFGRIVKGIDTYKEAVKLQKEAKKFDAIGEVWELHKQKLSFVVKQFTAGFTNILGEFGKELSPLARQAGDYFLAWTTKLRQGGLSARFKAAIEGFINGLGFRDLPDLLKGLFGAPGQGDAGSVKAWGAAAKGLGEGIADIVRGIRGLFGVLSGGSDDPEKLGRLAGRILTLSTALVIASPVMGVLTGIGTSILAFVGICKAAAATMRALGLMGGATTAGAAGTGSGAAAAGGASTGIMGRVLGTLGRLVPAIAMPLTTDASKADQDRLIGRLGRWADEQQKASEAQRKAWVDPPARVQKESSTEDWRGLIAPISYQDDELPRGVEKLTRSVDTLNGRLQLAALDGSGALTAQRLAQAAGTGTAGSVMSSVGIPYTPGAGGAALYGSRPGSKLPEFGSGQRFGGGGGGSSSPANDGPSDPIPGTPNPRLAGSRKALMDELDRDPALRRDVLKTVSMENRGSPLKMQTVLESMVNRAKMNGYSSLRQAIHSGFYGPVNRGGLRGALSEKDRRDGEAALKQVRNGSNVIGYRTDQGMLTDPGARRYMREADHSGHRVIGGENYFYMGQKGREWARRQEAMDAAAGTQGPSLANKAAETLGGKPDTYRGKQDLGDGIKGQPFQSARELAKDSPAESLARTAPPMPNGGGVGRSGAAITPVIHVHESGNAQRTANLVQQRLADFSNYSTTDLPSSV